MTDKLINFYKKDLSTYNLLWKEHKMIYIIFWILCVLSAVFLSISIMFKSILLSFIAYPLFIFAIGFLLYTTNKHFGLKGINIQWTKKVEEIKKDKLREYLTQHNLMSKEKLEVLAKLVNKKGKEKKIGLFFSMSFLLAICLILSSETLSLLLDNFKTVDESFSF